MLQQTLAQIWKYPRIIAPRQHILLLSHMRAYTSLLGHIMGSNPAICGYYEMHMGYYSWKSLVRQKLLYFREEETKPGMRFIFDKVLHDDHYVAPSILNSPRVWTVFALRHPAQTLPSIVRLYQNSQPGHEFASEASASAYYVKRLASLENLAQAIHKPFFYFDAEVLKSDTNQCLSALSEWLGLTTALSPTYRLQAKTARARFGDTSERLKSGRVDSGIARQCDDYQWDEKLMRPAIEAYQRARSILIDTSHRHCLYNMRNRAKC